MNVYTQSEWDPRRLDANGREQLWPWVPPRKLLSGAYVPEWPELEPYYREAWPPYFLPIPSTMGFQLNAAAFQPPIFLGPGDTLEYQAVSPVSFLGLAILVYTLQAAGATVELFYDTKDYPIINPGGPPLQLQNLGGTGKPSNMKRGGTRTMYLKTPLKIQAGASLLADVSNTSLTGNFVGQIVVFGFQPPGLGSL